MESYDDIFKDVFYKDDPEGYKQHLKEMEEFSRQLDEKDREERKKVAQIFSKPTQKEMDGAIDSFSSQELITLFYHLKQTSDQVERKFHEIMDEQLYSVSKTSLKQVVDTYEWDDVEKAMLKIYPNQEDSLDGYKNVFSKLKELTPAENEENLVITVRDGDVSGKKPGDFSSYAIEFERWEEWLGYYCAQGDLEQLGWLSFLIYCLWEMTFVGFEESEIEEENELLKQGAQEARLFIESERNK